MKYLDLRSYRKGSTSIYLRVYSKEDTPDLSILIWL